MYVNKYMYKIMTSRIPILNMDLPRMRRYITRSDSLHTVTSLDSTDFEISDVLNYVMPGEKHLPGMRYCGPGTLLNMRLDANGKPTPGNEPVDRVDQAAMEHDIEYSKHGGIRERHVADKEMIKKLYGINRPTKRERCERCLVIPILYLKRVIESIIIKCMDRFGV